MTEREMEDLLWDYPERFLNEPMTRFRRQPASDVGRADIIFVDRLGGLLVIELKRGKLGRGAIDQLHDYYGMLKNEFPNRPVELMVIANNIPSERRLACEQHNVECREISEKRFRDVAEQVGYTFKSEQYSATIVAPARHDIEQAAGSASSPAFQVPTSSRVNKAWCYEQDGNGSSFLAFVNARGSCSMRRFDATTGAFITKQYASGNFQLAFADLVSRSIPVLLKRQPNLERSQKAGLAIQLLSELQAQVNQPGDAPSRVNPPSPDQPQVPAVQHPARVERAWYYWRDSDGKGCLLAFVNAKGNCSMRSFDADTGASRGKQYQSGDFQSAFAEILGKGKRLTVSTQPNLERCTHEGLPAGLLESLQRQLRD